MDTEFICDVFDFSGNTVGRLELVIPTNRTKPYSGHEMEYYIPESIGMQDKTGIVLTADASGFVCDLFQQVTQTHLEYSILPNRYAKIEDAEKVCTTIEAGVTGLASFDVAFDKKENMWAIVSCDLLPNVVKSSTSLHVEFKVKSEGKQTFFCKFLRQVPSSPRGYTHLNHFKGLSPCPICLEDMVFSKGVELCKAKASLANTVVKTRNCEHKFHLFCLREWLKTNLACPLCRSLISEEV